ncbi:hypothetical protein P7K49_024411, partial [Saguinus oedipus]
SNLTLPRYPRERGPEVEAERALCLNITSGSSYSQYCFGEAHTGDSHSPANIATDHHAWRLE